MDRKRKAAADEGTVKAQRPLPRQHRDRERMALESDEAGTIQQVHCHHWSSLGCRSPLQAIEEVYAMPDIAPDDDAQETQRLLQHQHRDRQRRAFEGAEDKARRLQQCQQKDRERKAAVTVH